MKQILLSFITLLSLTFTACSDREKEPITEQDAAASGRLPVSGTYIPFVYGAKWAYDNGSTIDTTYLVRDSAINNVPYKQFTNSSETYFMRRDGDKYYRGEFNGTNFNEFIVLRTDIGLGKVYDQSFMNAVGETMRVETTISNLYKERYVKGKKYTNVIEQMNRFFEGSAFRGVTYDYYAKDKGLIERIYYGGGERLVYYNY